jgi:pimeloyl-ACP methyl ester carboxylesterase
VFWLWLGLGVLLGLPLLVALFLVVLYFHLLRRYLDFLVRVFQEKPLFVVPRGQPIADAEDVRFQTADGLTLSGCYLHTATATRRGIILFGLEFGSNRWACVQYCQTLLKEGFDVFAFEFRGQGDSDQQPDYEPLQWVTAFEVRDVQAAIAYLKARGDADPHGVGFFGISKGGGAGLMAASRDPYVRCLVTDGIFATHTTMVPYMRKWVTIVSNRYWLQRLLPTWYYGLLAHAGLRRIRRERGCRFPHLERALPRLAGRPLLMIHGGADTYIKPEMAQALFALAKGPKEFWLVDGAKHNQALHVAGEKYRKRVLEFFQAHLAGEATGDRQLAASGYGDRLGERHPGMLPTASKPRNPLLKADR